VSTPQAGYNIVNTTQVGYQVPNTPQLGFNAVYAPQGNNITRNVSEGATNNTPNPRIYEKRRCWICNDEKHLASSCPNKPPNDLDTGVDEIIEPDIDTATDESVLINYWCREPTLRMVSFGNVDTKGTSKCVYFSATINDKNLLCMSDADLLGIAFFFNI